MSVESDRYRRAIALVGGIPKPEPLKRTRTRKRKRVVQHEIDEKQLVMARDGYKCRWPGCGLKNSLEVAHLEHKGMGGDPKSIRTQQHKMISLCRYHHRFGFGEYRRSLDNKLLKINPHTVSGTNGTCSFFEKGWSSRGTAWVLVGREVKLGLLE